MRLLLGAALVTLSGCMAALGPNQVPEGYTLPEVSPASAVERVVLAAVPLRAQPLLWNVSNSEAIAAALQERGVPTRVSKSERPGLGAQELGLHVVLAPTELWDAFSPAGANEYVQLVLTAATLSAYGNLIPFVVPPRGGGRFVVLVKLTDARWRTLATSQETIDVTFRHLWWWSWSSQNQRTQELCARDLLDTVCDELARILRPHLVQPEAEEEGEGDEGEEPEPEELEPEELEPEELEPKELVETAD